MVPELYERKGGSEMEDTYFRCNTTSRRIAGRSVLLSLFDLVEHSVSFHSALLFGVVEDYVQVTRYYFNTLHVTR